MLQDLSFGRLENEFYIKHPCADDFLICVRDGGVLIHRYEDNTLELPTVGQVNTTMWEHWDTEPYRYLFSMQGHDYYLWMGDGSEVPGFAYEDMRALRQKESRDTCFALMTARHLYLWYRDNRFCGRCGTGTVHDDKERMLLCPHCGNMIFPKICPAVIVAVTDGDKLLLTKYAGRAYTRYALIAGYTEIGETLEQTVQREVMEEVGLKVKNIRYYKSQPWGVDGNILMGFYCDLDGENTIRLDETELSVAEWHDRSALPAKDDGISLTREMIRVFEEGREPRK